MAFFARSLRVRRLLLLPVGALVLIGLALAGSMLWVRSTSGPHLYSLDSVPHRPVAVVFGAQVSANGTPSPVLVDRLETARQLYVHGKVRAILVTQAFHLPRAVTLCRNVGMDAIGVPAPTNGLDGAMLRRLAVRDDVACVKAAIEIVARPDPRYLGKHETGIEAALASG